jgi:NAD(P)-dependent dehydrogenase (short-subunit alcohol dehydrogenase family)
MGVDLQDADFCCDLADPQARRQLTIAVGVAMPNLDAVIAVAGILDGPPAKVISVNFFGAVDLLKGLRPLLARSTSPRALVLSSTASRLPSDTEVIEACLDGDENKAGRLANASITRAYSSSKAALARWARRHAVTPEWGGAGILLNAIAPGTIADTGMTRPMLEAPGGAERLQKLVPSAIGRFGTPGDMAQLIAFLAGPANRYVVGQVVYADGGSDALQRGDSVW